MSDSRSPSSPPSPQEALSVLLAAPAGNTLRRALWLDEVDRRLRPHLPPSLAAHARLGNIESGRLVYVVDAPVWHAKLRLAAPQLLDAARSIGLAVAEVVVKTTPPVAPPGQTTRKAIPMSAAAQKDLQAALASLKKPDPTGSQ